MIAFLYEFVYAAALAVAGLSFFVSDLGFEKTGFVLTVAQIAITGLFVAFKRSKWTGRLIVIGVLITVSFALFLMSRNEEIGDFLMRNASCLWLVAIGAVGFVAGEAISRLRIAKIISSLALIAWMIVGTNLEFKIEKIFVAAAFLVILLTLTEEIQRGWEKTGYTQLRSHVVYVLPFIMVIFLLVLAGPAPKKPYDWSFAKKIYQAAKNKIEELDIRFSMRDRDDMAESLIGFSDRGKIVGGISSEDKEIMIVSRLSSSVSQIKLAGKTFSDFDGKEWMDRDESSKWDVLMDTISMWASLNDYTSDTKDYALRTYINIEFKRMKTNHAFLPVKAVPTYRDLNSGSYSEAGGDILWPETKSIENTYSVSYYMLNRDNDIFKEYLKNSKAPGEASYEMREKELNSDELPGCSYNDYLDHVKHIKETYLNAPVLSGELREYMDKVYEGAENGYEKLERLEGLLREFKYTEKPGELPGNINSAGDFLDYFVLESKEGFCSHFATAFVLLARAEGIPARYVQGYIINPKGKTSVSVNSSMAHSWPEVYFDGAGWIPFEPTPAYYSNLYWQTSDEMAEGAGALIPERYEYKETNEDPDESPDPDSGITVRIKWYMIVLPIVLGITFIVLFFAIGNLLSTRRFVKMKEADKFVTLCRQNLRILMLSGLPLEDNETLLEYRRRLSKEEETNDLIFLEEYERYLYNDELIEKVFVDNASGTREKLLMNLKKKSFLRYVRFYMGI